MRDSWFRIPSQSIFFYKNFGSNEIILKNAEFIWPKTFHDNFVIMHFIQKNKLYGYACMHIKQENEIKYFNFNNIVWQILKYWIIMSIDQIKNKNLN